MRIKVREKQETELEKAYGDNDTYYGEASADGFYATEKHPMAWAILNDDIKALDALHDGTVEVPEKPWNYHGWSEYTDGNYRYSMDTDYEETFVDDMPDRVVGKKDNQAALRKVLEYCPDLVLSMVDFWNAFHKGYDKGLLLSFLYNARNLYDDMGVDIAEYLSYDEFGSDPFNSLVEFLGDGNTSEARNSDADMFDHLYELGQKLYKWRKGELSFEEATPGIVKGIERLIGPRTAFNEFKRRGVKDDYFMATSMAEYAADALMDKGEDFVKAFLADKNATVPPDVWDAAVKTWIDDEKDL